MGTQVAINKGYHYSAEVWENDSGEYYVTVIQDSYKRLYRGNYYPMGNRLFFPLKWGKKRGAVELLDFLIKSDEVLLEKTKQRLDKLKVCKNNVDGWVDDSQQIIK
jgi:hypothetical protein